jgi:hypothetical protein
MSCAATAATGKCMLHNSMNCTHYAGCNAVRTPNAPLFQACEHATYAELCQAELFTQSQHLTMRVLSTQADKWSVSQRGLFAAITGMTMPCPVT